MGTNNVEKRKNDNPGISFWHMVNIFVILTTCGVASVLTLLQITDPSRVLVLGAFIPAIFVLFVNGAGFTKRSMYPTWVLGMVWLVFQIFGCLASIVDGYAWNYLFGSFFAAFLIFMMYNTYFADAIGFVKTQPTDPDDDFVPPSPPTNQALMFQVANIFVTLLVGGVSYVFMLSKFGTEVSITSLTFVVVIFMFQINRSQNGGQKVPGWLYAPICFVLVGFGVIISVVSVHWGPYFCLNLLTPVAIWVVYRK